MGFTSISKNVILTPSKPKQRGHMKANESKRKREMMRAPDVAEMLGVSKATVWGWLKAGRLPKPIKLGPNVTVWRRADIEGWIEERARESA